MKKLIKKIKKGINKFPRNYRFIPDNIKEETVFLLGIVIIVASGVVVGFDLYNNLTEQKVLAQRTEDLEAKLNFWQDEVSKHPDYRDGYFNLALINYQLKNFEDSRNNLDKALSIDPNFKQGRQLQMLLSSNL